jgi:hypothetical protein
LHCPKLPVAPTKLRMLTGENLVCFSVGEKARLIPAVASRKHFTHAYGDGRQPIRRRRDIVEHRMLARQRTAPAPAERWCCFAPGYNGTATILQDYSKCNRVLYCSTMCKRRQDSEHPAAPHKYLCKRATLLVDHAGLYSRSQTSELESLQVRR